MDILKYIEMAKPYLLRIECLDTTIILVLTYENEHIGRVVPMGYLQKSSIDLIAMEIDNMKKELKFKGVI